MDMILTPTDHLSPPSTTSRLSDSDTTSECDIATGRDGASISSVGSSSSPPAEVKQMTKPNTYHEILYKFDYVKHLKDKRNTVKEINNNKSKEMNKKFQYTLLKDLRIKREKNM